MRVLAGVALVAGLVAGGPAYADTPVANCTVSTVAGDVRLVRARAAYSGARATGVTCTLFRGGAPVYSVSQRCAGTSCEATGVGVVAAWDSWCAYGEFLVGSNASFVHAYCVD